MRKKKNYRRHIPKWDNFEKVVGMAPVKLLLSKVRDLNFFKLPISNGMLPEKLFDAMDKLINSVSARRGLIIPLKLFP